MCVNCDPAPSVCVFVCLCGQEESKQNGAATSIKEATIAAVLPDQFGQLNLNLNLKFFYAFFQFCLLSSVRSLQFIHIYV